MPQLLVAHPGHAHLLHGWISRAKPVVHAPPLVERYGETRGTAERYAQSIRREAPMLPLRDVRRAAEKRSCAF